MRDLLDVKLSPLGLGQPLMINSRLGDPIEMLLSIARPQDADQPRLTSRLPPVPAAFSGKMRNHVVSHRPATLA